MSAASQALEDARVDFVRFGDHRSAADVLDKAWDAWNESELSVLDYMADVNGIARWLRRTGDEERARERMYARAAE